MPSELPGHRAAEHRRIPGEGAPAREQLVVVVGGAVHAGLRGLKAVRSRYRSRTVKQTETKTIADEERRRRRPRRSRRSAKTPSSQCCAPIGEDQRQEAAPRRSASGDDRVPERHAKALVVRRRVTETRRAQRAPSQACAISAQTAERTTRAWPRSRLEDEAEVRSRRPGTPERARRAPSSRRRRRAPGRRPARPRARARRSCARPGAGASSARGRAASSAAASSGSSCTTSLTMRPSRIVTTRDAHAAMSRSWVTSTMVMPAVAIELLQQREDLEARARVEVARGLVGEEQRRVGHQRARDGDALLLAARELVRRVVEAVAEADRRRAPPSRGAAARARSTPRYCSGSSTFSSAVVRGSRLNPWKMKPMTRLRTMARASPARLPTSSRRACRCRASAGRGSRGCSSSSTCPSRSSRRWPRTRRARSTRSTSRIARTVAAAGVVVLRDAGQLDDRRLPFEERGHGDHQKILLLLLVVRVRLVGHDLGARRRAPGRSPR